MKCDSQKQMKDHFIYVYTYLTDAVTKTRVENNVKLITTIIRDEAKQFREQELEYMGDVYEKRAKWVEAEVPKAWPIIDAEDDNTRRLDYIMMGVEFELIAYGQQMAFNMTQNKTVVASDTEDNLHKKFSQLSAKLLDILQRITKLEAESRRFWSGVHQATYDYFSDTFKAFDSDLKTLKTTEIRTKSLQVFINELEAVITNDDFKTTTPRP